MSKELKANKGSKRPPKEMIDFLRKLEMMEMVVDLQLDRKMPKAKKQGNL
jgi:hypothetical protein